MSILFRQHRGGFDESMATTTVEINTLNDLTNEVGKAIGGMVSDGMIRASHYVFDSRNQWNTYMITVTGVDGVVGFTNAPISDIIVHGQTEQS
jgi:hypothetical protein